MLESGSWVRRGRRIGLDLGGDSEQEDEIVGGFAVDQWGLTPPQTATVQAIGRRSASAASSGPAMDRVEVIGYGDSTGPAWYNDGLGRRRAESVRQRLV